MGKTKLRKLHINDKEYGWSVESTEYSYDGINEVRVWDMKTKQIIDRFEVNALEPITPSMVVEYIEKNIEK